MKPLRSVRCSADDVEALASQFGRHGAREFGGLVGAVVEDLDVQLVARPVELAAASTPRRSTGPR